MKKASLDISVIAEKWYEEFKPLVTLMDEYIKIEANPLMSGLGLEFVAIA